MKDGAVFVLRAMIWREILPTLTLRLLGAIASHLSSLWLIALSSCSRLFDSFLGNVQENDVFANRKTERKLGVNYFAEKKWQLTEFATLLYVFCSSVFFCVKKGPFHTRHAREDAACETRLLDFAHLRPLESENTRKSSLLSLLFPPGS